MIKQRLVLLFDGTWNDPEDQTNVYRLSRRIHDSDGDISQRFFYDSGVGTSKWSRFRGGIFGYGLSNNLRQGYEWLVKHYKEGDEIWVFGFSRGAYTARSLIGMIRKCGLLHISTSKLIKQAEKIYRDKSLHPDSSVCTAFRSSYSCQVKVHFIGVWDTVGALGIPGTFFSEHGHYSWHDTELSSIVKHAFQAMALDEFRAAYDVSLWTHPRGETKWGQITVAQRWFVGAHANIGGGYGDDPLADITLQWMQVHASNAGLKMDIISVDPQAWNTRPHQSYSEFLGGLYAVYRRLVARGDGKFHRQYATGYDGHPAVNVSVDDSVWQLWKNSNNTYRPKTLTNAGQLPP